ncbi:MAG TPA: D-alanyl-D-alanine carboxypeptidase/D-alanyl-D-alanine-endopeptidase [Candidatus Acidoferrales bacterium]|nr:D-alanyl-D-alanine carboxypeptidase/D-alanyl-D-alanine-endopeptidase [Candidatus Acidoferrales bacterium]
MKRGSEGWIARLAGPLLCALLATGLVPGAAAQSASLAEKIQQVVGRPDYAHAIFGIEVYSLADGRVIYQLNPQLLCESASTTKLVTEGTALELMGADYRFHTRVYRTGPVGADGTVDGDLVLVASGDPNLSGRIQPDGTLAYENVDHSYAGSPDTKAVPGDPLLAIKELASQVAAHGVHGVSGRVLVDSTLFPEGERELGTRVTLAPIVVNDNVVDVTATPGATAGAPVRLAISPQTAYVQFVNEATTGAADAPRTVEFARDTANADGSHAVTVTGALPLGGPSIVYAYRVPDPNRFAEMAFVEALRTAGVKADFASSPKLVDWKALAASYQPANLVAEHVSPPYSEDVKVTLKVSQNLHASTTPYVLGAVKGGGTGDGALEAGFALERKFLAEAGLDPAGAVQSDGAGGAAMFTPDFMVHYLAYMAREKDFSLFYNALPILGRDGTLYNIQVDSPAAGHVHAKTGTLTQFDLLNHDLLVKSKALAGYMTTAGGRRVAFAIFVNRVAIPINEKLGGLAQIEETIGQALGEIAADIYSTAAR